MCWLQNSCDLSGHKTGHPRDPCDTWPKDIRAFQVWLLLVVMLPLHPMKVQLDWNLATVFNDLADWFMSLGYKGTLLIQLHS